MTRERMASLTDERLPVYEREHHGALYMTLSRHMAQGTNQALEDAMALATLLCGASAADVTQALTRYQTLRRERTARVERYARTTGIREDSALAVSLGHPWVLNYDVEQAALDLLRQTM